MHADIKGALLQLDSSYLHFTHRGQKMSKEQVKSVLEYGIKNGYSNTREFTDEEVDTILSTSSQAHEQ